METVQSLHCQGLQLKKVHYEEKKYDFVKNDHDSLGSLHNTDFEGKKQKKNYILLHEDLGNFERKT